ncbi:hypothetical protein B566_EDAN013358, partial [Ephemera danica]
MKRALPVAVKFLHKGNRELSRNMSSYLSLAAIENADLLALHIQIIIDSIISGNYPLARVLPQIYAVNKEPLHEHVMALAALLPLCENPDKLALLSLFGLIAKEKPSLLEPCLPQLCEYLGPAATASATMQVFLAMAASRPQVLVDHLQRIKEAAQSHPNTLGLAAQVISSVGKLSKARAQEALDFVLENLRHADRGSQGTLLREATLLCSSYPVLFTDKMLAEVRQRDRLQTTTTNSVQQNGKAPANTTAPASITSSFVNHNSAGVTIVKVESGGNPQKTLDHAIPLSQPLLPSVPRVTPSGRPRLGDSRSTGRLSSALHMNRSMTKLNAGPPPVGSHQNRSVTAIGIPMHRLASNHPTTMRVSSGGVTVTTTPGTISPTKSI